MTTTINRDQIEEIRQRIADGAALGPWVPEFLLEQIDALEREIERLEDIILEVQP